MNVVESLRGILAPEGYPEGRALPLGRGRWHVLFERDERPLLLPAADCYLQSRCLTCFLPGGARAAYTRAAPEGLRHEQKLPALPRAALKVYHGVTIHRARTDAMQPLNTEPATAAGARTSEPTVFRYATPRTEKPKTIVRLCRSDLLYSSVQVLKEGGENNLHAHNAQNGFWFVLAGRVRFYGEGDKVLAELGPHEGIHIPRGYYYWFESCSDEVLELLQVEAIDLTAAQNLRLNATERQDPAKQVGHVTAASRQV